jgi:hypothetical protein
MAMNGNRTPELEAVPVDAARPDALAPSADPKLRVTVVHTTPDGTVAALRAAADLAKHLDGRVALVAPEVIPFLFPLDEPHVAIDFMKKRYRDLVARAGLVDQEITIRILLCRDRQAALKQWLAPHSLIVIGGSTRWWARRERRFARWLGKLGHRVIFVDYATNEAPRIEAEMNRQAAFVPVLQNVTEEHEESTEDFRGSPRGNFSSGNRGMGGLNRA